MALSEAERIRRAKPGMYCFGGQLYLQVVPSTVDSKRLVKSWIFRFATTEQERAAGRGRERQMGLGSIEALAHQRRAWLRRQADYRIEQGVKPLDELRLLAKDEQLSLDLARELAAEARKQRQLGLDPIEERAAERAATRSQARRDRDRSTTFQQCAEQFIISREGDWGNPTHRAQWHRTLRAYVFPVFGSHPVADIDQALVIRALEPIWGEKRETASRVRGRIEQILDWAKVRGYREGENPARWRGHLEHVFPGRNGRKVAPHAMLPYEGIASFMTELRARDGVAARALELIILTATRSGEVLGARWTEINLEKRLWTIPAARMKAGKEHRAPLSDAACDVLRGLARDGERVFSITNMAMHALLARMGRDDLTVHGFRSTFRTWAEEQTAYPKSVTEAALAHVNADRVEAAYQRSDLFEKRRKLMDTWAAYCARPAGIGEVVPMRR